MTTRSSRKLLSLCLAVAGLAVASTAAGAVSPPSLDASAPAATVDPGCHSYNQIVFQGEAVLPVGTEYRVRHSGNMGCHVRVRIRCFAALFQGDTKISEIGSVSRNKCTMGSDFADSALYPAGTPFRENYRYKITLLRERQRWAGTNDYCPKRKNDRRTLICRDSHSTVAPQREIDRHG